MSHQGSGQREPDDGSQSASAPEDEHLNSVSPQAYHHDSAVAKTWVEEEHLLYCGENLVSGLDHLILAPTPSPSREHLIEAVCTSPNHENDFSQLSSAAQVDPKELWQGIQALATRRQQESEEPAVSLDLDAESQPHSDIFIGDNTSSRRKYKESYQSAASAAAVQEQTRGFTGAGVLISNREDSQEASENVVCSSLVDTVHQIKQTIDNIENVINASIGVSEKVTQDTEEKFDLYGNDDTRQLVSEKYVEENDLPVSTDQLQLDTERSVEDSKLHFYTQKSVLEDGCQGTTTNEFQRQNDGNFEDRDSERFTEQPELDSDADIKLNSPTNETDNRQASDKYIHTNSEPTEVWGAENRGELKTTLDVDVEESIEDSQLHSTAHNYKSRSQITGVLYTTCQAGSERTHENNSLQDILDLSNSGTVETELHNTVDQPETDTAEGNYEISDLRETLGEQKSTTVGTKLLQTDTREDIVQLSDLQEILEQIKKNKVKNEPHEYLDQQKKYIAEETIQISNLPEILDQIKLIEVESEPSETLDQPQTESSEETVQLSNLNEVLEQIQTSTVENEQYGILNKQQTDSAEEKVKDSISKDILDHLQAGTVENERQESLEKPQTDTARETVKDNNSKEILDQLETINVESESHEILDQPQIKRYEETVKTGDLKEILDHPQVGTVEKGRHESLDQPQTHIVEERVKVSNLKEILDQLQAGSVDNELHGTLHEPQTGTTEETIRLSDLKATFDQIPENTVKESVELSNFEEFSLQLQTDTEETVEGIHLKEYLQHLEPYTFEDFDYEDSEVTEDFLQQQEYTVKRTVEDSELRDNFESLHIYTVEESDEDGDLQQRVPHIDIYGVEESSEGRDLREILEPLYEQTNKETADDSHLTETHTVQDWKLRDTSYQLKPLNEQSAEESVAEGVLRDTLDQFSTDTEKSVEENSQKRIAYQLPTDCEDSHQVCVEDSVLRGTLVHAQRETEKTVEYDSLKEDPDQLQTDNKQSAKETVQDSSLRDPLGESQADVDDKFENSSLKDTLHQVDTVENTLYKVQTDVQESIEECRLPDTLYQVHTPAEETDEDSSLRGKLDHLETGAEETVEDTLDQVHKSVDDTVQDSSLRETIYQLESRAKGTLEDTLNQSQTSVVETVEDTSLTDTLYQLETSAKEKLEDNLSQSQTSVDETVQDSSLRDIFYKLQTDAEEIVENRRLRDPLYQLQTGAEETVEDGSLRDPLYQVETRAEETVEGSVDQSQTPVVETVEDRSVKDSLYQVESRAKETVANTLDQSQTSVVETLEDRSVKDSLYQVESRAEETVADSLDQSQTPVVETVEDRSVKDSLYQVESRAKETVANTLDQSQTSVVETLEDRSVKDSLYQLRTPVEETLEDTLCQSQTAVEETVEDSSDQSQTPVVKTVEDRSVKYPLYQVESRAEETVEDSLDKSQTPVVETAEDSLEQSQTSVVETVEDSSDQSQTPVVETVEDRSVKDTLYQVQSRTEGTVDDTSLRDTLYQVESRAEETVEDTSLRDTLYQVESRAEETVEDTSLRDTLYQVESRAEETVEDTSLRDTLYQVESRAEETVEDTSLRDTLYEVESRAEETVEDTSLRDTLYQVQSRTEGTVDDTSLRDTLYQVESRAEETVEDTSLRDTLYQVESRAEESVEESLDQSQKSVIETVEDILEQSQKSVVETVEDSLEQSQKSVIETVEDILEQSQTSVVETEDSSDQSQTPVVETVEDSLDKSPTSVVETVEDGSDQSKTLAVETVEDRSVKDTLYQVQSHAEGTVDATSLRDTLYQVQTSAEETVEYSLDQPQTPVVETTEDSSDQSQTYVVETVEDRSAKDTLYQVESRAEETVEDTLRHSHTAVEETVKDTSLRDSLYQLQTRAEETVEDILDQSEAPVVEVVEDRCVKDTLYQVESRVEETVEDTSLRDTLYQLQTRVEGTLEDSLDQSQTPVVETVEDSLDQSQTPVDKTVEDSSLRDTSHHPETQAEEILQDNRLGDTLYQLETRTEETVEDSSDQSHTPVAETVEDRSVKDTLYQVQSHAEETVADSLDQSQTPVVETVEKSLDQSQTPVVETVEDTLCQSQTTVEETVEDTSLRDTLYQVESRAEETVEDTLDQSQTPVVETVEDRSVKDTLYQVESRAEETVADSLDQSQKPVEETVEDTLCQSQTAVEETVEDSSLRDKLHQPETQAEKSLQDDRLGDTLYQLETRAEETVEDSLDQSQTPVVETVEDSLDQSQTPVVETVEESLDQSQTPVVETVEESLDQSHTPVVETLEDTLCQSQTAVEETVKDTSLRDTLYLVESRAEETVEDTLDQSQTGIVETVENRSVKDTLYQVESRAEETVEDTLCQSQTAVKETVKDTSLRDTLYQLQTRAEETVEDTLDQSQTSVVGTVEDRSVKDILYQLRSPVEETVEDTSLRDPLHQLQIRGEKTIDYTSLRDTLYQLEERAEKTVEYTLGQLQTGAEETDEDSLYQLQTGGEGPTEYIFDPLQTATERTVEDTLDQLQTGAEETVDTFNQLQKVVEETFESTLDQLLRDAAEYAEETLDQTETGAEETFEYTLNELLRDAEETVEVTLDRFRTSAEELVEDTLDQLQTGAGETDDTLDQVEISVERAVEGALDQFQRGATQTVEGTLDQRERRAEETIEYTLYQRKTGAEESAESTFDHLQPGAEETAKYTFHHSQTGSEGSAEYILNHLEGGAEETVEDICDQSQTIVEGPTEHILDHLRRGAEETAEYTLEQLQRSSEETVDDTFDHSGTGAEEPVEDIFDQSQTGAKITVEYTLDQLKRSAEVPVEYNFYRLQRGAEGPVEHASGQLQIGAEEPVEYTFDQIQRGAEGPHEDTSDPLQLGTEEPIEYAFDQLQRGAEETVEYTSDQLQRGAEGIVTCTLDQLKISAEETLEGDLDQLKRCAEKTVDTLDQLPTGTEETVEHISDKLRTGAEKAVEDTLGRSLAVIAQGVKDTFEQSPTGVVQIVKATLDHIQTGVAQTVKDTLDQLQKGVAQTVKDTIVQFQTGTDRASEYTFDQLQKGAVGYPDETSDQLESGAERSDAYTLDQLLRDAEETVGHTLEKQQAFPEEPVEINSRRDSERLDPDNEGNIDGSSLNETFNHLQEDNVEDGSIKEYLDKQQGHNDEAAADKNIKELLEQLQTHVREASKDSILNGSHNESDLQQFTVFQFVEDTVDTLESNDCEEQRDQVQPDTEFGDSNPFGSSDNPNVESSVTRQFENEETVEYTSASEAEGEGRVDKFLEKASQLPIQASETKAVDNQFGTTKDVFEVGSERDQPAGSNTLPTTEQRTSQKSIDLSLTVENKADLTATDFEDSENQTDEAVEDSEQIDILYDEFKLDSKSSQFEEASSFQLLRTRGKEDLFYRDTASNNLECCSSVYHPAKSAFQLDSKEILEREKFERSSRQSKTRDETSRIDYEIDATTDLSDAAADFHEIESKSIELDGPNSQSQLNEDGIIASTVLQDAAKELQPDLAETELDKDSVLVIKLSESREILCYTQPEAKEDTEGTYHQQSTKEVLKDLTTDFQRYAEDNVVNINIQRITAQRLPEERSFHPGAQIYSISDESELDTASLSNTGTATLICRETDTSTDLRVATDQFHINVRRDLEASVEETAHSTEFSEPTHQFERDEGQASNISPLNGQSNDIVEDVTRYPRHDIEQTVHDTESHGAVHEILLDSEKRTEDTEREEIENFQTDFVEQDRKSFLQLQNQTGSSTREAVEDAIPQEIEGLNLETEEATQDSTSQETVRHLQEELEKLQGKKLSETEFQLPLESEKAAEDTKYLESERLHLNSEDVVEGTENLQQESAETVQLESDYHLILKSKEPIEEKKSQSELQSDVEGRAEDTKSWSSEHDLKLESETAGEDNKSQFYVEEITEGTKYHEIKHNLHLDSQEAVEFTNSQESQHKPHLESEKSLVGAKEPEETVEDEKYKEDTCILQLEAEKAEDTISQGSELQFDVEEAFYTRSQTSEDIQVVSEEKTEKYYGRTAHKTADDLLPDLGRTIGSTNLPPYYTLQTNQNTGLYRKESFTLDYGTPTLKVSPHLSLTTSDDKLDSNDQVLPVSRRDDEFLRLTQSNQQDIEPIETDTENVDVYEKIGRQHRLDTESIVSSTPPQIYWEDYDEDAELQNAIRLSQIDSKKTAENSQFEVADGHNCASESISNTYLQGYVNHSAQAAESIVERSKQRVTADSIQKSTTPLHSKAVTDKTDGKFNIQEDGSKFDGITTTNSESSFVKSRTELDVPCVRPRSSSQLHNSSRARLGCGVVFGLSESDSKSKQELPAKFSDASEEALEELSELRVCIQSLTVEASITETPRDSRKPSKTIQFSDDTKFSIYGSADSQVIREDDEYVDSEKAQVRFKADASADKCEAAAGGWSGQLSRYNSVENLEQSGTSADNSLPSNLILNSEDSSEYITDIDTDSLTVTPVEKTIIATDIVELVKLVQQNLTEILTRSRQSASRASSPQRSRNPSRERVSTESIRDQLPAKVFQHDDLTGSLFRFHQDSVEELRKSRRVQKNSRDPFKQTKEDSSSSKQTRNSYEQSLVDFLNSAKKPHPTNEDVDGGAVVDTFNISYVREDSAHPTGNKNDGEKIDEGVSQDQEKLSAEEDQTTRRHNTVRELDEEIIIGSSDVSYVTDDCGYPSENIITGEEVEQVSPVHTSDGEDSVQSVVQVHDSEDLTGISFVRYDPANPTQVRVLAEEADQNSENSCAREDFSHPADTGITGDVDDQTTSEFRYVRNDSIYNRGIRILGEEVNPFQQESENPRVAHDLEQLEVSDISENARELRRGREDPVIPDENISFSNFEISKHRGLVGSVKEGISHEKLEAQIGNSSTIILFGIGNTNSEEEDFAALKTPLNLSSIEDSYQPRGTSLSEHRLSGISNTSHLAYDKGVLVCSAAGAEVVSTSPVSCKNLCLRKSSGHYFGINDRGLNDVTDIDDTELSSFRDCYTESRTLIGEELCDDTTVSSVVNQELRGDAACTGISEFSDERVNKTDTSVKESEERAEIEEILQASYGDISRRFTDPELEDEFNVYNSQVSYVRVESVYPTTIRTPCEDVEDSLNSSDNLSCTEDSLHPSDLSNIDTELDDLSGPNTCDLSYVRGDSLYPTGIQIVREGVDKSVKIPDSFHPQEISSTDADLADKYTLSGSKISISGQDSAYCSDLKIDGEGVEDTVASNISESSSLREVSTRSSGISVTDDKFENETSSRKTGITYVRDDSVYPTGVRIIGEDIDSGTALYVRNNLSVEGPTHSTKCGGLEDEALVCNFKLSYCRDDSAHTTKVSIVDGNIDSGTALYATGNLKSSAHFTRRHFKNEEFDEKPLVGGSEISHTRQHFECPTEVRIVGEDINCGTLLSVPEALEPSNRTYDELKRTGAASNFRVSFTRANSVPSTGSRSVAENTNTSASPNQVPCSPEDPEHCSPTGSSDKEVDREAAAAAPPPSAAITATSPVTYLRNDTDSRRSPDICTVEHSTNNSSRGRNTVEVWEGAEALPSNSLRETSLYPSEVAAQDISERFRDFHNSLTPSEFRFVSPEVINKHKTPAENTGSDSIEYFGIINGKMEYVKDPFATTSSKRAPSNVLKSNDEEKNKNSEWNNFSSQCTGIITDGSDNLIAGHTNIHHDTERLDLYENNPKDEDGAKLVLPSTNLGDSDTRLPTYATRLVLNGQCNANGELELEVKPSGSVVEASSVVEYSRSGCEPIEKRDSITADVRPQGLALLCQAGAQPILVPHGPNILQKGSISFNEKPRMNPCSGAINLIPPSSNADCKIPFWIKEAVIDEQKEPADRYSKVPAGEEEDKDLSQFSPYCMEEAQLTNCVTEDIYIRDDSVYPLGIRICSDNYEESVVLSAVNDDGRREFNPPTTRTPEVNVQEVNLPEVNLPEDGKEVSRNLSSPWNTSLSLKGIVNSFLSSGTKLKKKDEPPEKNAQDEGATAMQEQPSKALVLEATMPYQVKGNTVSIGKGSIVTDLKEKQYKKSWNLDEENAFLSDVVQSKPCWDYSAGMSTALLAISLEALSKNEGTPTNKRGSSGTRRDQEQREEARALGSTPTDTMTTKELLDEAAFFTDCSLRAFSSVLVRPGPSPSPSNISLFNFSLKSMEADSPQASTSGNSMSWPEEPVESAGRVCEMKAEPQPEPVPVLPAPTSIHLQEPVKTCGSDTWALKPHDQSTDTAKTKLPMSDTLSLNAFTGLAGRDMCRICHCGSRSVPGLGPLISPCFCRGTVALVHIACLERWLTESGAETCELCGYRFHTERIPRHSGLTSLMLWLSTTGDVKQLVIDVVWFTLMTPLAVMAGYLILLAIRVLIQAQDTPWSMVALLMSCTITLAAYYGWVSGAVRYHARNWFRWCRTNYDVHLLTETPSGSYTTTTTTTTTTTNNTETSPTPTALTAINTPIPTTPTTTPVIAEPEENPP